MESRLLAKDATITSMSSLSGNKILLSVYVPILSENEPFLEKVGLAYALGKLKLKAEIEIVESPAGGES